jgi:hypothetical protein
VALSDKFKSFSKLILLEDYQIFDEQFMYGHREVLLNYSELTMKDPRFSSFILEAGLQHGWVPDAGIWKVRGKDLRIKPRYVWNKRWEVKHSLMKNNFAIGAPWLYLIKDSISYLQNCVTNSHDTVLVFPSHSVISEPKNIINQVKHFNNLTVNFKRKFVCLYWVDYVNPIIQLEFRKYGFETFCAGFGNPRGENPFADDAGRSTYLLNLLRIFEKCGTIVTDEIQSGVFYALTLGMKLIYSPDEIANNHTVSVMSKTSNFRNGFHASSQHWVDMIEPQIKDTINFPREFQDLALYELGFDSMLTKTEVKNLPWIKSDVPDEIFLSFQNEHLRVFGNI